jgi:hypothetical protein
MGNWDWEESEVERGVRHKSMVDQSKDYSARRFTDRLA